MGTTPLGTSHVRLGFEQDEIPILLEERCIVPGGVMHGGNGDDATLESDTRVIP
jgi:hypothetical protein